MRYVLVTCQCSTFISISNKLQCRAAKICQLMPSSLPSSTRIYWLRTKLCSISTIRLHLRSDQMGPRNRIPSSSLPSLKPPAKLKLMPAIGERPHSPGSNSDGDRGSRKHTHRDDTAFRGVRMRKWGRYVSEIRLPGQKTRIWLGSFCSPEMAARAYDSAAFFLKGDLATLNFPDSVATLPRPLSCSRRDIQLAAAKAAVQQPPRQRVGMEPDRSDTSTEGLDWWEELGSISVEQVKEAPLMSPWVSGSMDEALGSIGDDDGVFLDLFV